MMENETSYLDSYVNGVMCLFIGMEIKMFKFLELLQSNFSLLNSLLHYGYLHMEFTVFSR